MNRKEDVHDISLPYRNFGVRENNLSSFQNNTMHRPSSPTYGLNNADENEMEESVMEKVDNTIENENIPDYVRDESFLTNEDLDLMEVEENGKEDEDRRFNRELKRNPDIGYVFDAKRKRKANKPIFNYMPRPALNRWLIDLKNKENESRHSRLTRSMKKELERMANEKMDYEESPNHPRKRFLKRDDYDHLNIPKKTFKSCVRQKRGCQYIKNSKSTR